ncbi:MAG: two-component regulator propeller domain-containing protein [Saprospiraceae bacterium]
MKNYFVILLLTIVFLHSCKTQINNDKKALSVSVENTESILEDFDPYFTPSKNATTPYGPKNITRDILQDKNGNIWLATWEGIILFDGKSFTNITNKEGLRKNRIFTIMEDKSGNIWFGTRGAGIYIYDGKTYKNITTKDGLVSDEIACFLEVENGNIWIGTEDGISYYDNKTYTNYTTKNGLSSNDINSIIKDKDGNLWIGTRGALNIYDGQNFKSIKREENATYDNVRCVIIDKKNNIWFGGNDGLWKYDGNKYENIQTYFTGHINEDSKSNIWYCASLDRNYNPNSMALYKLSEVALPSQEVNITKVNTIEGLIFGIEEDSDENTWIGLLDGVSRYDGKEFDNFKDK